VFGGSLEEDPAVHERIAGKYSNFHVLISPLHESLRVIEILVMNIIVRTTIDGQTQACKGRIDIEDIKEPQFYVSWLVFGTEGLIASKSENYFYKDTPNSYAELLERIKSKIESYKIGRKKLFESVEFCEQ
jgi:hypothetical protein